VEGRLVAADPARPESAPTKRYVRAMAYFVTGATGFIGSNLVPLLL
jgi:hypothetical protein